MNEPNANAEFLRIKQEVVTISKHKQVAGKVDEYARVDPEKGMPLKVLHLHLLG